MVSITPLNTGSETGFDLCVIQLLINTYVNDIEEVVLLKCVNKEQSGYPGNSEVVPNHGSASAKLRIIPIHF